VGYYGHNNAGDDWLLEKSKQLIQKVLPQSRITVLQNKSKKHPLGKYVIKKTALICIWRTVLQCDYVVFGGGSILQNKTSNRSLYYYLAILILARLCKTKTILLANGMGPIRGKIHQKLASRVLSKVDYITLRDKKSIETIQSWGIFKAILTADLSFYDTVLHHPKVPQNGIALSIRQHSKKTQAILHQWVNQLDDKKLNICCQYPIDQAWAINHNIPIYYLKGSEIEKTLPCKYWVTERYHAAVYAAIHGRPFLALGSDDKIIALAIELEQAYVDMRKPISLEKLNSVWMSYHKNWISHQEKLKQNVQNHIKRAKLNQNEFEKINHD